MAVKGNHHAHDSHLGHAHPVIPRGLAPGASFGDGIKRISGRPRKISTTRDPGGGTDTEGSFFGGSVSDATVIPSPIK